MLKTLVITLSLLTTPVVAAECKLGTTDAWQGTVVETNGDLLEKIVSVKDPLVIADTLSFLVSNFGAPPFPIDKVTEIRLGLAKDTQANGLLIAFSDADGCLLAAVLVPPEVARKMITEASGG